MNSYFLQYFDRWDCEMGRGCVIWFLNVALRIFMYVNKHQIQRSEKEKET